MIFERFFWGVTLVAFLGTVCAGAVTALSLIDPDTWPSANPPGEYKKYGENAFLVSICGLFLTSVSANFAFVVRYFRERRNAGVA